MLGRPLDFDPGTRYAYSNFGYCLLGRIVERAAGQGYEGAVRSLVLEPAGITRMRLGRTKAADRCEGEVCYYPQPGAQPGRSVFGGDAQPVPQPYGTFSVEAMDAHGGWIGSAVDLVRFVTALDGTRPPGLLKPETLGWIEAPPSPKIEPDRPSMYGLGWALHPAEKGMNWSHTGSLPGTSALVVRTHDRIVWAAMFNSRPAQSDEFLLELDRTLWKAVKEVRRWPEHDLFARYR
jgi:N-acyl-D-amino-acid deacylase